jgi:hypothetical protein
MWNGESETPLSRNAEVLRSEALVAIYSLRQLRKIGGES